MCIHNLHLYNKRRLGIYSSRRYINSVWRFERKRLCYYNMRRCKIIIIIEHVKTQNLIRNWREDMYIIHGCRSHKSVNKVLLFHHIHAQTYVSTICRYIYARWLDWVSRLWLNTQILCFWVNAGTHISPVITFALSNITPSYMLYQREVVYSIYICTCKRKVSTVNIQHKADNFCC